MTFKPGSRFLAAALLAVSVPALAATVYVKVPDAPLREGTSLGGPTVALLEVGTPLTVLSEQRFRVQVRTPSGKTGYVATRQVQSEPPDTGGRGLGGLVRDDRSLAERRTAASGRGLTETTEEMAEMENIDPAAVEAVRTMESFYGAFSEREVDEFLREGGLNP